LSTKKPSKDISLADEINDFFEQNQELKLQDLDTYLMLKIIIHALSNMISDDLGNKPHFTMTNNFMFMEIADLKFTIEIKDAGMYN
jgi:hypothetical protein